MRSGLKEAQILLVLGISLWILVLPAYQHFYGLEEVDISFLYLNLENPNGDGLGINLDEEGESLAPEPSASVFCPGTIFFKGFVTSSF